MQRTNPCKLNDIQKQKKKKGFNSKHTSLSEEYKNNECRVCKEERKKAILGVREREGTDSPKKNR